MCMVLFLDAQRCSLVEDASSSIHPVCVSLYLGSRHGIDGCTCMPGREGILYYLWVTTAWNGEI